MYSTHINPQPLHLRSQADGKHRQECLGAGICDGKGAGEDGGGTAGIDKATLKALVHLGAGGEGRKREQQEKGEVVKE